MSYYEHHSAKDPKPGTPEGRSIFSKFRHSALVIWLAFAILMIGIETALQGRSPNPCEALPSDEADIQTLANWIGSLQYMDPSMSSYGAIKIHHTPGHRDLSSDLYYRVAPYHANLAITGLLRAPVAGKLEVTERWLRWQLAHVDTAAGVVFDHWYRADGSGETTCPSGIDFLLCNHSDSFGSFAATFLGMAWTYYNAGGSAAFLNAPGNKERFESIVDVILKLQQPDGLVPENNSSVKYLMDNSEVYWGLKAMENLEARVFNDKTASQACARAAARVQDGIRHSLLNPDTNLYRVAELNDRIFWDADLDTWYPGAVSLLWPSLFSVTPGNSKTARLQVSALNSSWDGYVNPNWATTVVDPDGFLWASIGYSALLAGDCARARDHVKLIKAVKFPAWPNKPGFDWPFPVDDAGWLLSTLSGIAQHDRSN